jgi:regulator of sigma E protease
LQVGSPAAGKLRPGDVILQVSDGENRTPARPATEALTIEDFKAFVSDAGAKERTLTATVLRGGQEVTVEGLEPKFRVDPDTRGLGVQLGYDVRHPVVGGTVKESPAAAAGVPSGAVVTAVDGKAVRNWYDLNYALAAAKPGADIALSVEGRKEPYVLRLDEKQVQALAANHLTHELLLHELLETRQTSNPLQAAWWGVGETRDAVLQVYLTVRRMFQGSVDVRNVSGPVGIFHAGYRFADKGTIWLIWFMSIIGANLAVMNFLPIPIVDGGLFTFLIIEKIKGRPVSPKVQAVAQVVGLAILLSVFLFATYQDIARLPFLGR